MFLTRSRSLAAWHIALCKLTSTYVADSFSFMRPLLYARRAVVDQRSYSAHVQTDTEPRRVALSETTTGMQILGVIAVSVQFAHQKGACTKQSEAEACEGGSLFPARPQAGQTLSFRMDAHGPRVSATIISRIYLDSLAHAMVALYQVCGAQAAQGCYRRI